MADLAKIDEEMVYFLVEFSGQTGPDAMST